jgi:hypothetical protein
LVLKGLVTPQAENPVLFLKAVKVDFVYFPVESKL